MRFLVDECTGPSVARWLQGKQHDVLSVFDEDRGAADDSVLRRAVAEDRIIITTDKDFGEMVFRERKSHRGIVLLRLNNERAANKMRYLKSCWTTMRTDCRSVSLPRRSPPSGSWSEITGHDAMIRLHKALEPYINQLKTEPIESEVRQAFEPSGGIPQTAQARRAEMK